MLQETAAAVDAEDDEDEVEVEATFADKTFTQADARQDFFDRGNVLHAHAAPILPNAQSSPTANSIPTPPRFKPPSTPPPSEPTPLTQPTSDPKFVDGADAFQQQKDVICPVGLVVSMHY